MKKRWENPTNSHDSHLRLPSLYLGLEVDTVYEKARLR